MANAGGTSSRSRQHGAILLGLAGGMLVVAGGFAGAYYVVGTRSVASAATQPASEEAPVSAPAPADDVEALLGLIVEVKTASGTVKLAWRDLGLEVDPAEAARVAGEDLAALATRGALPVRLDRERAIERLRELKAKHDRAPVNAYLDLENRKILDDHAGQGLDIWGSLPRIATAARTGATSVELATIAIPAAVTRASLGIDDISHVLGHYVTKFPVGDRDRNYNLKLAASKIHGAVLPPGAEWSFNDTVGERSQKNGYKVAHVITKGEMVDGLAGGTCQISTTLFGAAFFAGLDIVKTINHSRPSTYTPLGFDATVVWPRTDLKLRNPYDFPVAVRYVVANGEAKVEVLGRKRPYDKIVFTREILEETPYPTEERLDEEMAEGEISYDQEGFPGFKIERRRRFYKNGRVVKTNKWILNYRPVTEYIRRGINPDPEAKKAVEKKSHGPKIPKSDRFAMSQ